MGTSLIIGNSINRVGRSGPSWQSLLEDLAATLGVSTSTEFLAHKPFPLFFDCLALQGRSQGFRRSEEVKAIVAQQIGRLTPGKYHTQLMNLRPRHVLTTNYDLTLEHAASSSPARSGRDVSGKYNLFRRRIVGDTAVWHLHGCVDEPRTIVLGYDHYAGSIERMRGYLKREYHGIRAPFKRGIVELEAEPNYSWIDVFLRDDMHIVGLGLDFAEIDLWWAIYYKASLRSRGKAVGETHYYVFVDKEPSSAELARLDLLAALRVTVHKVPVVTSNYESAWDDLMNDLQRRFTV